MDDVHVILHFYLKLINLREYFQNSYFEIEVKNLTYLAIPALIGYSLWTVTVKRKSTILKKHTSSMVKRKRENDTTKNIELVYISINTT